MDTVLPETVLVSLRSVARSGMSRRVELYCTWKGETWNITRRAAVILGWHYNGESMRVDGCGTDAAFWAVYNLSSVLWPKGYKVPKGQWDSHADTRGYSKSGGYALRNQWF